MIMRMIIGIDDWAGVKAQSSINPKRHCCKPCVEGIRADYTRSRETLQTKSKAF